MQEVYVTSDIWLSAYLLSETEAELVDYQINCNGRRTVSFSFEGERLRQISQDYCTGQAIANVTQLRAKLNLLRDIIFQSTPRKNK